MMMEHFYIEFPPVLTVYYEQVLTFFDRATGSWVAYQVIAILAGIACSYLFTRGVSRRIETFLDGEDGHWLRVWKREILERIAPVIFLIVVWSILAVFRQVTWPSNTLMLGVVAKLTTAWILINILASVIRNKLIFRLVSVTLWIVAALSILRLLPSMLGYLDSLAFSVGDARLSVLRALKAVGLLAVLVWGVGFLSRIVDRGLSSSKDISPSMKVLLSKIVRIVFVMIAIIAALTIVGIDLTAFAVFSGAIGVGIGFGLQKTVSNFISGISLLLDKSIKPGDVISVGNTFGWITQLNTRYTSVITRDGREHLIPNENLITQEVVNWSYSDDKVRLEVPFGVGYGSNPHKVKTLVERAVTGIPRILASPAPIVHFSQFGESSLDFELRFWIRDPIEGLANIKSQILFRIWDALTENNIEIPYPKRDLYAPSGISVRIDRSRTHSDS